MLSESKTFLVHTSPMIMCELSVFIFKLSMQILSVGHERTSEKVYEQIIANKIILKSDSGFMQMQTKQIVNTLMLDDATAAKFTPVYEKYLKELRECRMMTHKARTEKTKGQGTDAKKERPSMTDDEIATMLRNQFTQSRKMLDVREKYYNEFSKILSQKQILKIYQQEKMNANKFKKEFDRRKGQKPGQGHHQGQRSRAPRPDQK